MSASRASCAIACCSLLLAPAGCSRARPETGEKTAAAATASEAVPTQALASGSPNADAAAHAPSSPDPLLSGEPVRAQSIGHTSYVLELTLSNGSKAVFKPRSRLPLGDRRYKGEIAAYRLARALGLDEVPRAVPRSFHAASLRGAEGFAQEALVDPDGRVRGALMPWIDQYRVLPLESDAWRAKWEPWLTDPRARIPDDQRPLAAEISTMIAFDYVTANWDRWSGGNVAKNGATGKVLFVDNDGAFYEFPPQAALTRQLALLRRMARFSRGFVRALRGLDERKLHDVFGEESPGVPLLPGPVVAAADARRRTVLALVDARVSDAGADVTLGFE